MIETWSEKSFSTTSATSMPKEPVYLAYCVEQKLFGPRPIMPTLKAPLRTWHTFNDNSN